MQRSTLIFLGARAALGLLRVSGPGGPAYPRQSRPPVVGRPGPGPGRRALGLPAAAPGLPVSDPGRSYRSAKRQLRGEIRRARRLPARLLHLPTPCRRPVTSRIPKITLALLFELRNHESTHWHDS